MSSEVPPPPGAARVSLETGPGTFRLGPAITPVEMRALIGHCRFAAPARQLLVTLLPDMVPLWGHDRLMTKAPVIHEEMRSDHSARGPMEYVTAWRKAVARDLLLRGDLTNA